MYLDTKYNIGDKIKAKAPHRNKAEVFTIAEIRVQVFRWGVLTEYRSEEDDSRTNEKLGMTGCKKNCPWYPERYVLGLVS